MFDCNWLARKLGKGGSRDPVPLIAMLAEAFVMRKVHIYSVCDGPTRHHSKKESFDHLPVSEQALVDTLFYPKRLMELVEQSREPDIPHEEETAMEK